MSDYKELIEKLKSCEKDSRSLLNAFDQRNADAIRQAADAIEQLVKERDAALNRLSWEEEARFERERERMLEACRNGDVYL